LDACDHARGYNSTTEMFEFTLTTRDIRGDCGTTWGEKQEAGPKSCYGMAE